LVELITDRTQYHVALLNRLRKKPWNSMTSSEQMAWNGEAAKGAYNYTDLNRVETAVSELAVELGLSLTTKTNWTLWDIPVQADMDRYLGNVAAIRDACPGEVAFPDLPDSMNNLSFEGANSIEKVLLLVYEELHGSVEPDDPEHRCVLGEFVLGVCRLDGRAHVPDEPDFPDTPVNPGDADYIRSGEIFCGEVL
jgi:hypothetical protein